MNAPIVRGVKEPGLGDREKREKDNEEYNNSLTTSLDDSREKLKNTLYPNKIDQKDVNFEKLEDNVKIDENPYSPLIDGFVNQGLLSAEEGHIVKEALIKSGNIEKNIGEIKEIETEKIQQIQEAIQYLNSKEGLLKNKERFNNDFSEEADGLKQSVDGGEKGKKELIGQNKHLIEKLGNNYFPINGTEGANETKEEALNIAFKMTLNKLMEGKKFKRPDTFDNMKRGVTNSELDFITRFKELKKIDTLINNDQSRAIGKGKKHFEKGQKIREIENISLEEKFNQFKESVAISIENIDKETQKGLLEEAKNLKEEAVESGDVFVESDIDILIQEIEESFKEEV
ncbi:MAG: hypothetical protein QM490_03925 [Candidatus Gracilibacteria bacterium]